MGGGGRSRRVGFLAKERHNGGLNPPMKEVGGEGEAKGRTTIKGEEIVEGPHVAPPRPHRRRRTGWLTRPHLLKAGHRPAATVGPAGR
jgi:hypothetical protein